MEHMDRKTLRKLAFEIIRQGLGQCSVHHAVKEMRVELEQQSILLKFNTDQCVRVSLTITPESDEF